MAEEFPTPPNEPLPAASAAEDVPAPALPAGEAGQPAEELVESVPSTSENPPTELPEMVHTADDLPGDPNPILASADAAMDDVAAEDDLADDEEVAADDDLADDEEVAAEQAEVEEEPVEVAAVENKKKWYVVKVQSNREDTIKEAIERRVKKEGLEEYYGQIVIPVEKYTEVKQDKNGRKVTRTKERKLYPGYLFVEVEYNDRILYLFRETSGVGDFVGSHPNKLERAPTPMSETEVLRMIGKEAAGLAADVPAVPQPPPGLGVGDRVKVVDGTFNGMEGIVKKILDTVGKVEVEVSIFGRPVNVELDYYQVEEI